MLKPAAPENIEKWNYTRAKYTIDYLNLNYSDLTEIRKLKWQETTVLIKEVNRLNTLFNEEPTNQNNNNKNNEIDKIRKMLSPDQELT